MQDNPDILDPWQTRLMIHELKMHQLELEMQIVALKQKQLEFEASRNWYFNLYDTAPAVYCTVSEKGQILEANLAAATLFGMPKSKLIKQPITRFFHEEDHGLYFRHCRQLFETGVRQAFELRVLRQDGTVFRRRLMATAAQDAAGAAVYRIMFSDIPSFKHTADADELRASYEICFQVLNGIHAIIYAVDMKTNEVVFINSYGQSLWGVITRQIYWQTLHPSHASQSTYYANSDLIGPDGSPSEGIVWEFQDTVNKRWYDCRNWSTYWPDGRMVRLGLLTDITDRKRDESEKAVSESQSQHLEKAESLKRMAGAIAHHLNNHLQVVMGNLEMVMNDLPQGVNPIEKVDAAMQATHKAAEVSALMLTYIGHAIGKFERLDLSDTCRRSLSLIQAAAPKNMIVKADFPASGPIIRANAGQIFQVLSNLITNAWESADANRRGIGLTVKSVSPAHIPVAKRFPAEWQPRDPDYACLEVADAGCGISEKNFGRIFDPFFSTKFIGRGMGLSVVLGIVRAHHGVITVESTPGMGSIFRVFIPMVTDEPPLDRKETAAATPKYDAGGTVLLIDDEETVRNMAVSMLRRIGFDVLEAKDGVEAVEVFQQHKDRICCVLSDLTMPHMDGWDTLAALRRISPDIPVILSSGYDEAHVLAGEHPERPDAFLGKPYRLQELGNTIRHTLAYKKKSIMKDHHAK